MERRANVTQEAVNQACIQLAEEGKSVTINAVINIVGGSFSTIGSMVKQWKHNQQEESKQPSTPDKVQVIIDKAGSEIWNIANTLATQAHEAFKAKNEEQVSKLNADLKEHVDEIKKLESSLSNSNQSIEAFEQELKTAHEKSAQLEASLLAANQRVSDKDAEIKRLIDNQEKLQQELVSLVKSTK